MFDHLPKTAGTAITNWFVDNLGAGSVTPISALAGPHIDILSKFGGLYPVVSAHLEFMDNDDLDPRWQYVTLLREPVDRCLSWIYYLVNDVKEDPYAGPLIDGARQFLASNGHSSNGAFLHAISGHYVRHFASIASPIVLEGEAAFAAAIRHLKRYDVVGFQERMDDFLADVATLVGLPAPRQIKVVNKTSTRVTVDQTHPDIIARLRDLNRDDIALYEAARAIPRRAAPKVNWLNRLARCFAAAPSAPAAYLPYTCTALAKDMTTRFLRSEVLTDLRGEVRFRGAPQTVRPMQRFSVQVTLDNQSDQVWGGYIFFPVNLSYHWVLPDGTVAVMDGDRTAIGKNGVSYPGTCLDLDVDVKAPPAAGRYELQITCVQERHFWFEHRSSHFKLGRVEVWVN
ncbi:sulfotransferase family 2 domain-containing protein [Pseudoduganella namucuonensis]|uniref:Sulfotransferase family protein n=1 Tax=Pseudoduganella namucuonensis TaxID=1035707 RepID=A0A1I7M5N1_9BURK|nr:sulfotransferase family 2 domain-containing protein [Pseudoduganella namucuonensis]SFV17090.1 Sulfotransferase family protein [Pseudoduganella namucuonensis]